MNGRLYPPIIDKALPAFHSDYLELSFRNNRAVDLNNEVGGFVLIIKSPITNEIIIQHETSNFQDNNKVKFDLTKDSKLLIPGGFYKVQLAYIKKPRNVDEKIPENERVGYFSDVGIIKYTSEPGVDLDPNSYNEDECFIGICTNSDITEKVYSYKFSLYDSANNLIETTGERLHNSSADTGQDQRDVWYPLIAMDNGLNYTVYYNIVTINGVTGHASMPVTAKKDEQGYVPRGIRLKAESNSENGYVKLSIYSAIQNDLRNLTYGKFEIFKSSNKDNFKTKERIATFSLENEDLYEKTFKDLTVESGYTYQYILQQKNDHGIYSEEVYSNKVEVYYEHMYLFDGIRQLKIKFDPKVATFKDTILESKVDTIGSKYPFIFKNNTVNYKELSINGLISYQMDEENLFLHDEEIWPNEQDSLSGDWLDLKGNWTHNLTDQNITAERAFKLRVLEWLNDGQVKLFKSPVEGNYIVRLMNVSLSPVDTVGRMLHSFQASAYEIDDVNSYSFCQALIMDRAKKYIGYKTIPLYDFPQQLLALPDKDGNYYIVNNNSMYEIIAFPNLEYVVGARFEDVKPGTGFTITLERESELKTINIYIGATGFYRIPGELGYHIKSIKLKEASWETGDRDFDIINNRGQVTYEYERMAKHNNFNDISAIEAGIVVAAPWYPSWYEVSIQEPYRSLSGLGIYTYTAKEALDAFIQVAYADAYQEVTRTYQLSIDDNTGQEVRTPLKETPGTKISLKQDCTIYDKNHNPMTIKIPKLLICGLNYETDGKKYFYKDETGKLWQEVETKREGTELTTISKEIILTTDSDWGEPYELNDVISKYKFALEIPNTYDGAMVQQGAFSWEPQKVELKNYGFTTETTASNEKINNFKLYFQVYNNDGRLFLDIDSPTNPIELDNRTEYYDQVWTKGDQTTGNINLFIVEYDSKGKIVPDYTVTENGYRANPFYTTLKEVNAAGSLSTIQAVNYHLDVMTVDANTEGENIVTDTDIIYRNYIPNKLYDAKNVNDEYYIKEEMLNLYDIDFELIQVFYDEDLTNKDYRQHFIYKGGTVQYEDTIEDGGYQYTQRRISGLSFDSDEKSPDFVFENEFNKDFILAEKELYFDTILLDSEGFVQQFVLEGTFTPNLAYFNNMDEKDTHWLAFKRLYQLPNTVIGKATFNEKKELTSFKMGDPNGTDVITLSPWVYLNGTIDYAGNYNIYLYEYYHRIGQVPLYKFTPSKKIAAAYFYEPFGQFEDLTREALDDNGKPIIENGKPVMEKVPIASIYFNARVQGFKNYTKATTPEPNEIIFVFDDSPYNIVKIDLTERLSYGISADKLHQEDIRNLAGVYLGTNVRGFATYKHKLYSYKDAVVGDGILMDLTP